MSLFLASLGFGLVTASVLAIASVGFTLQFGVTDVLNLAYGAVMIAGAFIAYLLNNAGVSVWAGLVVAVVVCSLGSVALNSLVYTPFQRRGATPITMVIVSLGITLIIEFGVQALAGGTSVSYHLAQGPTLQAGGLILTAVQLAVIALSLVVMAVVHVLLRYTRLGKAMRATAANRMLARNCGIRTGRVITVDLGPDRRAVRAGRGGLRDRLGQLRRHQHRRVPGPDPGRRVPGRPRPGLRRHARRGRDRHRHRGQRRVHPGRLQVRDRVPGPAGDARRPPGRPAGSPGMNYYLINLLIYAAVDAMACLGLSQQFGIAGVTNFGFIIFQAAGGYAAAVLAMPSDHANGGFQSYIGGWHLPFPLPWLGAAVVGGALALPFTFLVGRRLRGDFAAVGLLVTAVLVNLLVTNYVPLFNGDAGISLIPEPLQGVLNAATSGYQWAFTAIAVILCAGVYLLVRRLTESPYGRSLRAMRDNDIVADSLGKDLRSLRTGVLVTGGAIAGLSGGILVSYITTWSPAAWGYAETVVLFAAVIIGGAGNHRGAVLGAILVPVGFEEVTRFIPSSNSLPPNLIPSLEWVAIGLLIVIFLWFRPQGILPERKRVIALPAAAADVPDHPQQLAQATVASPPAVPAADPGVRPVVLSAAAWSASSAASGPSATCR